MLEALDKIRCRIAFCLDGKPDIFSKMSGSKPGKRVLAQADKQAAVVANSFAAIRQAAVQKEDEYVMDYLKKNENMLYRSPPTILRS